MSRLTTRPVQSQIQTIKHHMAGITMPGSDAPIEVLPCHPVRPNMRAYLRCLSGYAQPTPTYKQNRCHGWEQPRVGAGSEVRRTLGDRP
ncbi:hypothetical protein [Tateyamaria sp.]|uniref:hypothetical protein n=1 Tax=Tateyamaria sp. TaxID=1929288 RepID=UPI00329CEBCB